MLTVLQVFGIVVALSAVGHSLIFTLIFSANPEHEVHLYERRRWIALLETVMSIIAILGLVDLLRLA